MENICGWIAQAGHSPERGRLSGAQKADWLVIGAGITGLSAAHTLADMHPQARIVVVDRQRAAQGASARNSGFVVAHEHPAHSELIGTAGFAGFETDTMISRAASEEVRQRIGQHAIECDFRDSGYYFAVNDAAKLDHVEAKLATLRALVPGPNFCRANSWRKSSVPVTTPPRSGVATAMRCCNRPSM